MVADWEYKNCAWVESYSTVTAKRVEVAVTALLDWAVFSTVVKFKAVTFTLPVVMFSGGLEPTCFCKTPAEVVAYWTVCPSLAMSVRTLLEFPAAGAVTFDASRALLATLSIAERRFC